MQVWKLLFQILVVYNQLAEGNDRKKRSALQRSVTKLVSHVGSFVADFGDSKRRKKRDTDSDIVTECSEGSVLQDGLCSQCPEGSYAAGGICVACSKGTYQTDPGQTTCISCTGGTSTVSVGSDDSDLCIVLCTVPEVPYGSPSPGPGYDLAEGEDVTITCQSGYKINNQNVYTTTCDDELPSCTYTTTTTENSQMIKGTTGVLTCQVISGDTPTSCVWYKEGTEISDEGQEVTSDGDTHSCTLSLDSFSSSDEASYQCRAVINSNTEVAADTVTITMLEITYDDSNLAIEEGESATLTCSITNPDDMYYPVVVQWMKGDKLLGSPIALIEDPGETTYALDDVAIEDAGNYSCRALFQDIGQLISNPKAVIVRAITIPLLNKWSMDGNTALLTCACVGDQEASVVWEKNFVALTDNISTTYDEDSMTTTSTLTLTNVSDSDAELYQCTMEIGDSTSLFSSGNLYVYTVEGIVIPPIDRIGAVGDTITFTCTADTPSSNEVTDVQWFKVDDDEDVEVEEGVLNEDLNNTQYQSNLVIADLELFHMGDYYCKVSYTDLDTVVESDRVTLYVRGIGTSPSSQNPSVGGSASFTCVANGGEVTIDWYLGENLIDSGVTLYSYDESTQSQESMMIVTDAASEDEGVYKCVATYTDDDSYTTNSTIATLVIYNIEVTPGFGILGSSVTMTCIINSDREPEQVSWRLDNNVIDVSSTSEYSASSKTTNNKITIDPLEEDDFGDYSCIAYYDSLTTSLTAEGASLTRLQITAVSASAVVNEGESITLTCSVNQPEDFSDSATIAWLKDDASVAGGIAETTGTTRTLSLSLNDLDLSHAATYKCQASYPEVAGSLEAEDTVLFVRGWQTPLGQDYLVAGNSRYLTCIAQIEQEPDAVSWVVNEAISSDAINSYEDNLMTSVLYFDQPAVNKTVECRATVSGVTIETTGSLTLLSVLSDAHSDITMLENDTEEFTCVCDDYMNPIIVWYKDSVAVSDDISSESSSNELTSTLTISNVGLADRGTYFCMTIWRANGTFAGGSLKTRSFTVSVTTVWENPTNISVIKDTAASLSCDFISSAEADSITWLLEDTEVALGSSDNITTTYNNITMITTSTLDIASLSDEQYGSYKCAAQYGSDTVSTNVGVVTNITYGFTDVSRTTVAEVADSVTLTCTSLFPDGDSKTITWYKDGTELTGYGTTQLTNTTEEYAYVIDAASVSNTGSYSCLLFLSSTQETVASLPIQLYIRGFSVNPTYNLVKEGDEVTFTCILRGDSPINLIWMKDDTQVSSLDSTKSVTTTVVDSTTTKSQLYAYNVASRDVGNFTCQASWSSGNPLDSEVALLLPVSVTMADVYGIIGEDTSLVCVGIVPGNYVPTLTLIKEGNTVKSSSSPSLFNETTDMYSMEHIISNVSSTDFSDRYNCELDYDSESLTSEYATLLEIEMFSISDSQSVAYGESLTLTCSATLVSSTTVITTWLKGNRTFDSTSEGSSGSVYLTSLELVEVSDDDSGTYRCSMDYDNLGTMVSDEIVIGIDSFKTPPSNTVMFAGNELILSCLIKADVEITWKKDGDLISSDYESTQDESGSSSVLTYSDASATDSGDYLCEAEVNGKTINSDAATVLVYEFSLSPEFKKVKVGELATLSCSVEATPTIPTVTWQKNGEAFSSNGVTNTSSGNYQSSELRFNLTSPEDLGVYRCAANFSSSESFNGGVLYTDEAALIVLYIGMVHVASASEGDTMILTAEFVNDVEVDIDWYLDGELLETGGSISISQEWPLDFENDFFQYVQSTLTIANFETDATGTYVPQCTTTFNGVDLNITGFGAIVDLSNVFLTAGFAEEGATVTMYCMYDGTGNASSFSFQKEDEFNDWNDLSGNSVTISTFNSTALEDAKNATNKDSAIAGSMLVINDISSADVGFYRCTMEDTLGTTTESMTRTLQLLTSSIDESKMFIETGERAYISCTFTGPYEPDVELHVFDSDAVDFYVKDESALWYSAQVSTSTGNDMLTKTTTTVFAKVISSGISKITICSATFYDDSYPEIQSTIASSTIEVQTASVELSTVEPTLTVYEGIQFTFICQYSFGTTATVELSPTPIDTANEDIADVDSGITTGYTSGLMGTLTMDSFTGPYVCSLTNIDGNRIEKQLSLEILEIPALPDLEETILQSMDYAWLTCTYNSNLPLMTLSWFTYDDEIQSYYTTYRSSEGNEYTGISERVYGLDYWDDREFHCNVTVQSNSYASEASFIVKRVHIIVGDIRQFGVSSNEVYVGDELIITCKTEVGSTAVLFKYWSTEQIESNSTVDDGQGVITYTHTVPSATLADKGNYWCEIKKDNRWNVYLGYEHVEIHNRCEVLENPNTEKGNITCYGEDGSTESTGTNCVYFCLDNNLMSEEWGESIWTECLYNGYWSHTYTTGLLLEMPSCSEPVIPTTYKVNMVVTFSGLSCPPARTDEIFDFIVTEKFRDVDMRGFTNTLVSAQNSYTTDMCKFTWAIEPVDVASTSPDDLADVWTDQNVALYSSKRFAVVENAEDSAASGYEVECPSGSGTSSSGLYCVECGVGTYSTSGHCVSCPIGSYQVQAGQDSCQECPDGNSTLSSGSTECLETCDVSAVFYATMDPPAGYIVEAGTNIVTTCDEGFSIGTDSSVVHECGTTKYCSRVLMTSGYEGYASLGGIYEITCEITTDDDNAEILWYKDNTELNCTEGSGDDCTTESYVDGKTTTSVLEITAGGGASYSCYLQSDGDMVPGDHAHEITTLVNEISISDDVLFVGDVYNFTCHGEQPEGVDLPPTIMAFINGKEVFDGSTSDDGLDLIVTFQATSDVALTCEFLYIQVEQDIVVVMDTSTLNLVGLVAAPTRDLFIPDSEPYDINCEMHNADGIEVVVVDGGNTATIGADNSSESVSTTVTKSQTSLNYYCKGTVGSEYVESTPYTFTFGTTNVISHPTDVYTVGASVSFTCEVPAGSTVSFKKTEDSSLDFTSQTVQSVADSGNETFTLTISAPAGGDHGEYYCEGTGGRSKGAMLNFVQILKNSPDLYRDEGESVTFMCEATGLVDISWSTPNGDVDANPHTQYITRRGDTVGELATVATAENAGLHYCIAGGMVSSYSSELVVMIVELTVPDSIQRNEEITVTCVIYGDHDGVTMSNDGRLLTVETPLDAMTTKASGEGTYYTSTYNTSLCTFTNDTTTFTCTSYYDSFEEQHTEEVEVYLFGFSEEPSDFASLSDEDNFLSVKIGAHPDQAIEVFLMQVIDDGDDVEILHADSIESGSRSIEYSVSFETEDTGYYYYKLSDGNGTTINSDTFKVTVYGAYDDDIVIPYPGSSLDSLTLTCIFNSPTEVTVTWSDESGSMGSDNPLVITTFEDELLTSLYTISAGGNYECLATILGEERTVTYVVQLLNYTLAPADAYQSFFDNTEIILESTPNNSAFTTAVFSADGSEIDLSAPQNLYESRNLTSVVSWTDESGLHSGDYYQTDMVYVAGVYLETPELLFLVAGETALLQCTAVETADIKVNRVSWSMGEGTLISTVEFVAEGTEPITILAETNITWDGELSAGDEVEITCTVEFTADNVVEKNATITVTLNEKCSTIYDVENGVVTASASSIYPSDTVLVSCNDGYQLSGQTVYTCEGGQLWEDPPTCVEMKPLCSPVAPESARVTYIYPELTMSCIDEYAPFMTDFNNLTCGQSGWDALSTNNPVSSFVFCGGKTTPYSKSVTAYITYKGGSQYCTSAAEANGAYAVYEAEIGFAMDGVARSFVECLDTSDGYSIRVKYTVDYVYLSYHDYLNLDDLTTEIKASDGSTESRKRQASTWYFDSLTYEFDLSCPLDSPPFNDQCVECPAGYYSTGATCLPCAKGEYQHEAGRTFCLACPSGETTPGRGSDSIDHCGVSCLIPTMEFGETMPLGGSEVPESIAVTVVCYDGYSVPYDTDSTYSCSNFASLNNVEQFCEETCVVPAAYVSDNYMDVVANTNFLSREQITVDCVDGYSVVSNNVVGFIQLDCSNGVLGITDGYCDKDGLPTGMWVLIILLVIVLLLLLILVPLCCYLFRDKKNKDEEEYKDVEMRPQSAYSCSNRVIVRGNKSESETLIGNSNPFKVSSFNDYIRGMAANRNEGFIKEFRSISVGSDTKKIISQLEENYNKNRYASITTYDHSRVRLLKIDNDPNSDYINASYINGYVTPNAYIATQGPLKNTVDDFWRMIWEQNVSSVVMLTNLTQAGQVKSVKYWPDTEQQFGVVKVKKMSENKFGGFVVRELDIEVEGKQRTVFQYHYAEWPDVGYPVEDKFLTFLYYIRHMRQDSKKPLVVHCSAGAGWTGVFLGLDLTLDRLTKEDTVDVLGCVNSMRQQRSAMVQNEPQYIFLHKLLVDCVNGESFGKLRANRFRSNLEGAIFVNPSAAGLNDYEGGF